MLVAANGDVKVSDFGLASFSAPSTSGTSRVAGSPAYMAPEQFDGHPTQQSDIWAVGVLLYQMLGGASPFTGASFDDYREQVRAPHGFGRDLATVPQGVRPIIRRCLEVDPGRRYFSATALNAALMVADAAEVDGEASCPRCGAALASPDAVCPDCTFADADVAPRPFGVPGSAPGDGAKPNSVPWRRRLPVMALVTVLVATVLAVTAAAAHLAWKKREASAFAKSLLSQPYDEMVRGELSLVALERVLQARLAALGGRDAPRDVRDQLDSVLRARQICDRFRSLETSRVGYADPIGTLLAFLAIAPDSPETDEARARLELLEPERDLLLSALAVELDPRTGDSKRLRSWETFLEHERSGYWQSVASDRVQFWQHEIEQYAGFAQLRVISASGLPWSDAEVLGRPQPDSFLILLQGRDVIHWSRAVLDNQNPVWNEPVRVFLAPGRPIVFEIRDRDPLGSDLLARRALAVLPPDGPFALSLGGIRVQMEVAREW